MTNVLLAPVQWLIDFLLCLAKYAVGLLLAGLATLVNLLVAGLMALLAGLLAVLPSVDLSSIQPPAFLAWANWLFPLDQFVIACGVVFAVLAAWMVIGTALRWLRVVE